MSHKKALCGGCSPSFSLPSSGGGNVRTFAEKIPWAKLDKTAKTFTVYYTEKETWGSDEYDLRKYDSLGYPFYTSSFNGQPNIEKAIFDKSFAEYRPKRLDCFFFGFYNLKEIEGLEYLNTSEATDMRRMFEDCSSLLFLDLSNFDTSKVKDMATMFCDCSKLTTILASDKFVTISIKEEYEHGKVGMFDRCYSLVGQNYQGEVPFNSDYVDDTYAKCDGGYFTNATRPYATLTDGTLTLKYGFKNKLSDNDFLLNNKLESTPEWLSKSSSIKHVKFDESFAVAQPYFCCNWFKDCQNLETVEGLENFDASQVKTMEQMFYGCTNLKTLNLSNLDVSKVTNMRGMFYDCKSLTELDLTGLNTANVIYTRAMFSGCSNLASIYVSDGKFNMDNVTSSTGMFAGCKSLRGDIPFDASSATDKTYAKVGGGYLTPAPLCGWATLDDSGTLTFKYGDRTQMEENAYLLNDRYTKPGWYDNALSITKVVFDESFANCRPSNCAYWFDGAKNLTAIEGIENLNTSEAISMYTMFSECTSLTTLDLSHFDTSNVEDMGYMFWRDAALKTIYMGENFVSDEERDMFIGVNGTLYVAPNRYKELHSTPGFRWISSNMKAYLNINANAPYGTLCVPMGSTLDAGTFTGFDKLYRATNANSDKGTLTLEEAKTIEPGVAYVYHRNMPEDAEKSIITFAVDYNVVSVSEPLRDGSLLKGTFKSIVARDDHYILQTDGNFHPVPANNTFLKVGTYHAYLDLSSLTEEGEAGAKAYRMVFEDGKATGIDGIIADNTDNGICDNAGQQSKVFYDLMGRRVNAPVKGNVYIVNGKKTLCK